MNHGDAQEVDGTLSVDWVSESVNDASEQFRADEDIDNLTSLALEGIALLDEIVVTEGGDRYRHLRPLSPDKFHGHRVGTPPLFDCRIVNWRR